jgi:DSF synthase
MDMTVPQAVLGVPAAPVAKPPIVAPPGPSRPRPHEYFFSEQLSAFYDSDLRAMWLRWKPSPRPSFNPDLLRDLDRYCRFLTQTEGRLQFDDREGRIEYAVLTSRVKDVFNLGGDLQLFTQLIEQQDRDGLLRYGRACIDVLYRNYIGHGLPINTISLIQGECLGGGFEAALSSDVLIAERHARFGFPEIMFNLFPGMGAYSFLERKVGRRVAEELIGSGKAYSADDMLALGVVDQVVDTGTGESAVASYIETRTRVRNGLQGLAAARRCVARLDYQELDAVVGVWVDTALRLGSRDLRLMQRLALRQGDLATERPLH